MTFKTIDLPVTTDTNGHVIELGSTVKSYDFPHRAGTDRDVEECRAEGKVEGCVELDGCASYVIRVTKRVWNGEEVDLVDEFLYPPVNGCEMVFGGHGGLTCGVVVVDSPQPATADEALRAAVDALNMVNLKCGELNLEDWAQVNRAVLLAESYQADLEAHLEERAADRGDADLYGSRERDNMAGGQA